MERVAGIQTGGSERAFDVYMKARYLHEQHPGHGVTFATGTPISNTMVEMYTLCGRPHKVYYVAESVMWRRSSRSWFHWHIC
jgi:N12 class adenine-specific DNA methylase